MNFTPVIHLICAYKLAWWKMSWLILLCKNILHPCKVVIATAPGMVVSRKPWSSFVFLYKAYEISSTLEFSLLVGSNSPKLFSFLAHLFPPLLLREWELMGSVLQDTDPSGTSSTNHLCKGLNFNCPEAAEVNGTVPGTAGGSSSLTLRPDLLTSLWLPRCHSLGVTSAHVCLSWN